MKSKKNRWIIGPNHHLKNKKKLLSKFSQFLPIQLTQREGLAVQAGFWERTEHSWPKIHCPQCFATHRRS